MSYLGLDLATRAGWALWSPEQAKPVLGTLRLNRFDVDEIAPVLEKLRRHLSDIYQLHPLDGVFYEAPIMTRVDKLRTLQLLLGLANMVEWWCLKVGVKCRQVEMRDWRRHFMGMATGGRDALKAAAIEACRVRGWSPQNDDEADAAGVLDYGLHCFGVEVPWRDKHLFGGRVAA